MDQDWQALISLIAQHELDCEFVVTVLREYSIDRDLEWLGLTDAEVESLVGDLSEFTLARGWV